MPPQMGQPPLRMAPPPMGGPGQMNPEAKYLMEFQNLQSKLTTAVDDDAKKELIGDLIYNYIERLTNEDMAPKITGMILDLEEKDLQDAIKSLKSLTDKVNEGKKLLEEEDD